MLALSPPVAAKLVPLTILAPSEARNTTSGATSSGSTHGTPSGSLLRWAIRTLAVVEISSLPVSGPSASAPWACSPVPH